MPIDPGHLRALLRADAVNLVIGGLVAGAGLLALATAAAVRRRMAALAWLAAFALLWGLRLLARTRTFRLGFDLPEPTWEFAASALTYFVPLPLVLFARALLPAWRRTLGWCAAGLGAFAVLAVVSDVVLDRPNAARTLSNSLSILFILVLLAWIFRSRIGASADLRTVRVGAVLVSGAAVLDNLRGMGLAPFPGPDLESFGFVANLACLGTVAVRRLLGEARRLAVIDRELGIARQIQSSILPQELPAGAGLAIAARYRPMTAVAGDFYDFLPDGEGRVGVLVADVSGHGVPAALIASMVKLAFGAQRERAGRPAEVLSGMNEALCGRLAGQYVTAAYLFIDTAARRARYAAAGHPPLLRLPRPEGAPCAIEQNGLVLGVIEGTPYTEVEMPLQEGDRFLLYTDGLLEAADARDELFGPERLAETLAGTAALDPAAAAARLLERADAWSGRPPSDDCTIVVVDWAGGGPT